MVQQASIFAERLQREAGDQTAAQVRRGFRLAFQREATADEIAAATKLVEEHGLAALCRALLNATMTTAKSTLTLALLGATAAEVIQSILRLAYGAGLT